MGSVLDEKKCVEGLQEEGTSWRRGGGGQEGKDGGGGRWEWEGGRGGRGKVGGGGDMFSSLG